jgi:hypothetical protein
MLCLGTYFFQKKTREKNREEEKREEIEGKGVRVHNNENNIP